MMGNTRVRVFDIEAPAAPEQCASTEVLVAAGADTWNVHTIGGRTWHELRLVVATPWTSREAGLAAVTLLECPGQRHTSIRRTDIEARSRLLTFAMIAVMRGAQ